MTLQTTQEPSGFNLDGLKIGFWPGSLNAAKGSASFLVAADVLLLKSHQNGTDKAHLEDGGAQVEDERAEHKGDAPRAAVDGLGQRPRLAAEMEAQVQIVQVQEDVLGDAPDGALGHLAEHGVPQLVEEGGAGPGGAVWGEERRRREDSGMKVTDCNAMCTTAPGLVGNVSTSPSPLLCTTTAATASWPEPR